ncbi:stage III sporulation protein AG [Bacillus taeanensis]|uniref:Stage III sporulation protein AG n=1 Tax=Bacillus taeanensis TaxID=273032 RepID=A0A366XZP7_9BACI|nr:stage III sporulation protein AG [Bacillus taeanensis]RBW70605.1 stage III sporulation protein AG [Bacillus taeanensis]
MKKDEIKALLTELFTNKEKKKKFSYSYLVLALGIGVVFMMFGNGFSSPQVEDIPAMKAEAPQTQQAFAKKASEPSTMIEYENYYENQLREILEEIVGVSNVSVMINLDATEQKIYEKNYNEQNQETTETDKEGGKRTINNKGKDEQVVIINDGEKEVPVVVATEKPKVRGVVITATGAENMKVKQQIVEAVTRVLDVPSHRLSVLPKKIKEE